MVVKKLNPLYSVLLNDRDLEAVELFKVYGHNGVPSILRPMVNTVTVDIAIFMYVTHGLISKEHNSTSGDTFNEILNRMKLCQSRRIETVDTASLGAINAVMLGMHDYEYGEAYKVVYNAVMPIEYELMTKDLKALQRVYNVDLVDRSPDHKVLTVNEARKSMAASSLRDNQLFYQAQLANAFIELKKNDLVASTYAAEELTVSYWRGFKDKIYEYLELDLMI